jgi:hypothetical protein
MIIPDDIRKTLVNLPCCRLDIGAYNSLSIGLGKKYQNNHRNSRVNYYGEWEFGTYSSMWQFWKDEELIACSTSISDKNSENEKLALFLLDKTLYSIEALSETNVRFIFSNNLMIDFCKQVDDDEILHILHINGCYWELEPSGIWRQGKSPSKKQ